MLGTRASQNCDHGSPTCYYMRVIGSGAVPKFVGVDGGSDPTQGRWQMGELCADNPHYKSTNGYALGNAYNYGAATGGIWHAPKFLQMPTGYPKKYRSVVPTPLACAGQALAVESWVGAATATGYRLSLGRLCFLKDNVVVLLCDRCALITVGDFS